MIQKMVGGLLKTQGGSGGVGLWRGISKELNQLK